MLSKPVLYHAYKSCYVLRLDISMLRCANQLNKELERETLFSCPNIGGSEAALLNFEDFYSVPK